MNSIFSNTEVALALKSNTDLKRANFLFSLIEKPTITKIGTGLLTFALKYKIPFAKSITKNTLFKHFCGGETMPECASIIKKMHGANVYSVLDYSVEGKEEDASFDRCMREILDIISFAKDNPAIPFTVFKPTGFGRLDLYTKVSAKEKLSDSEIQEWERVRSRYYRVCEESYRVGLPVMIDAEESWAQDIVDDLTEELMRRFNKEKCIVWGTLQLYRIGRMEFLKEQKRRADADNYYLGFKIVRGAYMEKERLRAKDMGYPSPIQPDKESTDKQYNDVMGYMVENRNRISLYAGTHNEKSNEFLTEIISTLGIEKNDPSIWFGQLYGMSDNISFNLGKMGYNIAKYLPYGPITDVAPYLMRRAEENTSVKGQTGRELSLLRAELRRRKNIS